MHEELILADWYRRTVHTMTPETRAANRRLCEATLTLTLWSDGERVTQRERRDARECLAILDAAEVCGSASPGLHSYTCELPYGHDGHHRANVSPINDATWGVGYGAGVAYTAASHLLTEEG